MPVLSGGDLTNIRTQPIGRLFKLYVFQAPTIWTGTVGGAPSRGDRALTVATDTGDPANMVADSTIRVTDSADDPKGYPSKVRMRSYAAGTLTIADNDIDWAAGDKLTSVILFEIWPRIPYIDATDVDNILHYKDRDITWADDNTAQPPKANAGPAAIGELNGGVCDIVFKNEGSFIVPTGAAVTSHLWDAYGGSPDVQAGAENTDTVTYRYDTAGYYYVKYTVTDGNGKTGHKYTPVIIDDGTYPITRAWPGDRYWDKNGWVLSRRLSGIDADPDKFVDGSPVFLVADSQITGAGAFTDNRSNLRWSGWLISDETRRGAYDRETSYRAVSSCHILQTVPAFPVGLYTEASPADWYHFTQLSLDSVVFLLLQWQSTVLQVCDYHPDGDWTNRLRPGEECKAEDLLTQINAVLAAMFADLRCDRQGILRAMRDEWHLSAAEEAARDTVMTLANTDYHSVRYGPRRHRARVREVRALGVDGSDNPYIAGAPGEAPLDGGRYGEVTRLSPKTQAELNQWAGQELSTENWSIPLVLRMAGEFDAIDPALGEYIAGALSSFDAELPDGPYSVEGVRFVDDHETKHTMGEWELLPDPTAYGAHAGETREIPEEPEKPDPPELPPEPPIPIIPPAGWPHKVYVGTQDEGVYYTENFTGTGGTMPTWAEVRDVSGGGTITDIRTLKVDRSDPEQRQYVMTKYDNADWADREVYKRDIDVSSGEWVKIMDLAEAQTYDADIKVLADFDINYDGTVWVLCYHFINGGDNDLAWHLKSEDYGSTWVLSITVTSDQMHWDENINAELLVDHAYYYTTLNHGTVHKVSVLCRDGVNPAYYPTLGTSIWNTSIAINYGSPNFCYARQGTGGPHLARLDMDARSLTVVQNNMGAGGLGYRMWSSLNDHNYMRYLFGGKLFTTIDNWTSLVDASPSAITQIGGLGAIAPFVESTDEDMMIIGAYAPTESNPHTVGILYGDTDTTVEGKAGDDTVSAPYTDSIPRVCGGVCRHGVQAVVGS